MTVSNRTLVDLVLKFYSDIKNRIPYYQDLASQIQPMSNLQIDGGRLAELARKLIAHEKGAKKRLKVALTECGIKIPKEK